MSGVCVTRDEMKDVWRHIETTNSEMGAVKEDVATIKADMVWVKRYLMGLFGTSMTLVVALIVFLIQMLMGG